MEIFLWYVINLWFRINNFNIICSKLQSIDLIADRLQTIR